MNGTETYLTYDELVNEHWMIAVWFSNIQCWPLSYGVWRWTANYGECTLPYDVLNDTNDNLEQEQNLKNERKTTQKTENERKTISESKESENISMDGFLRIELQRKIKTHN